MVQAGLKLMGSNNPPASASQVVPETVGMCCYAWPQGLVVKTPGWKERSCEGSYVSERQETVQASIVVKAIRAGVVVTPATPDSQ